MHGLPEEKYQSVLKLNNETSFTQFIFFPCVSTAFPLLVCLVRLIYRFEHDRRGAYQKEEKNSKNISYIESYSPDLIFIKLNISFRFKSLLLLPRLSKHVQDLDQAFNYQSKK